jgi:heat shock protein HslJ
MGMQVKATVPWYRRWSRALAVLMLAGVATAFAADAEFPFDQELLLDAAPKPGSKRVPGLEVQSNGSATIDLWCANVRGQVHVSGPAITIVPQSANRGSCSEESMRQDAEMLEVLTKVTTWRREGNAVVLIGPQTFRYRVSSH